MILSIITLVGALGMFLYGMNLMSSGLQKATGSGLRHFISTITSNPFKGVLTGFGTTTVIQSSSATTVMVVGFVNAGLMTLKQAIGVIMGANIGTTMTAWIIALFGFKADISILAVPLMALGFIFSIAKKDRLRNIGECVVGFSLLFLGLSFMKSSIPDLQGNPEALAFIQSWSGHGIASVLIFCLVGAVLTIILQSSSATVALTLIFLNMGWLQFDMAAAMVLGENIGTTITANIAAAVGKINAKRTAMAHTVFNLFGIIWAIALFRPFISLVEWCVGAIGLGTVTENPVYGVSMLHTLFNIINTSLLIGFIPFIEKLVCRIIKDNPEPKSPSKLVYIDAGLIPTPELAIAEADKEVVHFGQIMQKGFEYLANAINAKGDDFEVWREKLVKYEEISDRIEFEIISFLNKIDRERISEHSYQRIKSIIRIAGEMESLGDSGEAISRYISRAQEHKQNLTDQHKAALNNICSLLFKAYDSMIYNLQNISTIENIDNAIALEVSINEARDKFRDEELNYLEENKDAYFDSIFFFSLLEELEKMGDFIINISQAVLKAKTFS